MDFLKNFKDKVNERLFASDEDYDEDEVNEEDYAEEPSEPVFDNGMEPPAYNSYSYSPTGGLNAPEYNYGKSSASSSAGFTAASSVNNFSSASTDKKGGTIYSMSNMRPVNKFKLNSVTLHEIYGAKEVALLMMEKDTIIIVNFSPLSDEQKLRAMDFLDGARCVTNAIFARLDENIIVFVPENVELCGDFQSQVDLDSIK